MKKTFLKKYWPPILLSLLGMVIFLPYISKPFIGHHDWNSAVYANIARNFVRYGLLQTKLGQVRNPDIVTPEQFSYHSHYPPLFPLMLAAIYTVFGITHTATRAVPALSQLSAALLLYYFGKTIKNQVTGFVAAITYLIFPLTRYFGLIAVHETVLTPWVLGMFLLYYQFLRHRSRWLWYGFLLLSFIAASIIWSAVFASVIIALHYFFFGKNEKLKKIIQIAAIAGLSLVLYFLYVYILTGATGITELSSKFVERANPAQTERLTDFTWKNYLKLEVSRAKAYFSAPVLLLSAFGILLLLVSLKKDHLATHGLLVAIGIYGLCYPILFSQAAFIHDYMLLYSAPFIALCSAWVLSILQNRLNVILFMLVCVLYFLCITQTTNAFLVALYRTDINARAMRVGKLIFDHSHSGERSLITSNSYKEFQEVFIDYYARRSVGYTESLPLNFEQYRLIIIPKDHAALLDTDKRMLELLYVHHEDEHFIWYDLKEPRLALRYGHD